VNVADLAPQLRASGLTPRALAAWAGTDRVAALPARVTALRGEPLPAAIALSVFVAGGELAVDRATGLPLDALLEAGLVELTAGRVRARVAIVPLGPSLIVCDRVDAPDSRERVSWPDDSSHHLAAAIPAGRRGRWLDLGCGSAFAQLARPELAVQLVGVDLNPRAVERARLGAALSGVAHLEVIERGVGELHIERAELVTCNAPLPYGSDAAIWRRADPGFFTQLWPAIAGHLAPNGLAVVHSTRHAIPEDLPGERVIVSYAPDFCVLWWRPDAEDREACVARALTSKRPHVDAGDREDALAGAPC
jgi:SAM-dependent methyltransferase